MIKVPEDWKLIRLSQIGDIVTGTTPLTNIEKYWGGEYSFVTPTDFVKSKYIYKTERTVTKIGTDKGRIIPKDSIMVVCIASVGEVAMSSSICITNQQINTIICNKNINPHYIYYTMFFSKDRLKRFAGITTSPIIKKSLFEKFFILLPPISEQDKIAEILSTVDKSIEEVNGSITKTSWLKKSLMQELLTKGIGHKEFKETEIGEIPKEWNISEMEEVTDINKELKDPRRELPDKKLFYVDIDSVENETGIIKDVKEIIGRKAPSRARRYIRYNDVVMSTVRPYLKAFAIIPEQYDGQICSTGFAVLRCKEKILPQFLLYTLFSKALVSQFNRAMVGAQYPALNTSQVKRLKIPLPTIPEQKKISEILSTVDKRIQLLKEKNNKLERVKKGLMNDLLTGRRRVKVEA
jgi:type I restriction enzyme, S subunit